MKKLLLITLILLSFNCFSQNRFEKIFKEADLSFTEGNRTEKDYIDTIRVKALVSYDYSYDKDYNGLKSEPVFITHLLQIRKHYWPYHPDYMIIDEKMSIEVIGYLYENKMKLSKIINVWQVKYE